METDATDAQDLPVDSDTETAISTHTRARPVHLRSRYAAVVALGGTVGTAAREAVTLLAPSTGKLSAAIFVINLVGALLLGVLLETLVARGPDEGRRRTVRLLLGTGVMGGFTTYSTLATGVAQALLGHHILDGIIYGAGTVVIGGVATFVGIAGAAAYRRRTTSRAS